MWTSTDRACAEVMRRYELTSKRDAVNLALRTLAGETLSLDDARALRGSGWDGDLQLLRSART
jgi:Arc/MetJ family transcription regulator